MKNLKKVAALVATASLMASTVAMADCNDLPDQAALDAALTAAQAHGDGNGGFGLHMWGTIVDRAGIVCAVASTGGYGDQWPGSRVISAQKANTANSFSLTGLALSTANVFTATQPGGSLYGLQHSNPVDTKTAYRGKAENYGTDVDPMVNHKIGGVNVFGGGLALYDGGVLVGAIGVSGDSSCADHNIAWRTRMELGLDSVFAGVGTNGDDNIVYDIDGAGVSALGWGHPECSDAATAIAEGFLPAGT